MLPYSSQTGTRGNLPYRGAGTLRLLLRRVVRTDVDGIARQLARRAGTTMIDRAAAALVHALAAS